jgi:glycosyltransferase involved in cell wall biosynthesis
MGGLVSVVVPVKHGARFLAEVLDAVARQRIDAEVDVLVIDSGSRDGSVEIARGHGARVIEIPPSQFGHGRTRNMAAAEAHGDRIAFLTQDATPAGETWLADLVAPLDAGQRVGLTYGPHLPRPDTSPMIARELVEFFSTEPGPGFFSNVNSAVLRECWEEVRFRDVEYSEDQAFARDAMAAGWRKEFVPLAGVLHAHDYPWGEFMRRYFDEYRGLKDTMGHVEPIHPARIGRTAAAQVARDARYMRASGMPRGRRLAWGLRSARHHAGRAVASALGSRHEHIPGVARRHLSLERRSGPPPDAASRQRVKAREQVPFVDVRAHFTGPPAPLAEPSPHDADKPLLHFAWVVPPYRRGSGGHMTLFTLAKELELRGHSNSVWVHDPGGTMGKRAAVSRRELVDHFVPLRSGVFHGFEDWHGADVAFATGWQTAYPLQELGGCKLKAYLVQDYEPDFYPASAERLWAEETYRMGYPAIAASPWLRDLMRDRYGAQAEAFELGVDFDVYRPVEVEREPQTVVFYARPATPRRATEMGLLALAEVARRRPGLRVVLFGDVTPPPAPFDYEWGGVMTPEALAALYNRATLGLVISLTNYSRMPKEMMACGLPVVDVAHPSVVSVFGVDEGVISLAQPDPASLADRLESLLADGTARERQAEAARRFVTGMTWTAAAEQVEAAARGWLAERWSAATARGGDAPDPETRALDSARAHLT